MTTVLSLFKNVIAASYMYMAMLHLEKLPRGGKIGVC